MSDEEIADRLQRNAAWLRKTAKNATIAGLAVRVQEPSILIEDLDDAREEITTLRATIDRLTKELDEALLAALPATPEPQTCEICNGTGDDQRTRRSLHKQPCPVCSNTEKPQT
jgi:DNA repair exonuclease SbcCD ATPase subunit